MPTSDAEGKDWSRSLILSVAEPHWTIVDVGPGEGTYSTLLREYLPEAKWVGVEAFEPYVSFYGLEEKYDEIIVSDVRELDPLPQADLYILGDVIEHMSKRDGMWMLERVRESSKYFLVSLPIIHSPQGCVNGNDYERHLSQWQFDEMKSVLNPLRALRGHTLGVYWCEGSLGA